VNGDCSISHRRRRLMHEYDGGDRIGDGHRDTWTTVEVV